MKSFERTLRIFLGLFLLANGLNFWFHFLPITPPADQRATSLMNGLVVSGLFEMVKFVEIGAGVTLLVNRFVPLGLVLMLPLTVVIVWVDFVLIGTTQSVVFGGLLAAPHTLLLLFHLRSYLSVLTIRSAPGLPSLAEFRTGIGRLA